MISDENLFPTLTPSFKISKHFLPFFSKFCRILLGSAIAPVVAVLVVVVVVVLAVVVVLVVVIVVVVVVVVVVLFVAVCSSKCKSETNQTVCCRMLRKSTIQEFQSG